jgi:N-acyl homoserine lactone hydrolase
MHIHALTTGTVEITTAMERGRGRGVLRFARTLLDRRYTRPLPIHAWLIEHPDGPLLVDTGELATSRDMPIARFHVTRADEIDQELERAGYTPDDLAAVVLTHLHGDHANGLARLPGVRALASADALTKGGTRRLRKRGTTAEPIELTTRTFGAFAQSTPLTGDGRVLAVPVPGHARGQIAVLVVEDDHHVLLAGDSAYSQAQLVDQQPDGVSVSAREAVRSMQTILAHAARHPTVFLPSHDPGAQERLRSRSPLRLS